MTATMTAPTTALVEYDDALARWEHIMTARRPVYEEVADATFDTSSGPLQAVSGVLRDTLPAVPVAVR